MKWSNKILTVLGITLLAALLAANLALKAEYDQSDKTDQYAWSFEKILEHPFKHIKIADGSIAWIIFEPAIKPSVRIQKNTSEAKKIEIGAYVKNDTLFLTFPKIDKKFSLGFSWQYGPGMRTYCYEYVLRIFSPQLQSVSGDHVQMSMYNLTTKDLDFDVTKKSSLHIESAISKLGNYSFRQDDSSEVTMQTREENKTQEPLNFQMLHANLKGCAMLNLGQAKINSLDLSIDETSSIQLSGSALKKLGEPAIKDVQAAK